MTDPALSPLAPAGRRLQRRDLVFALRGAIAEIERKHASLDEAAPLLPFGIAEIDDVLGGGLAPAALHEIAATGEAEIASATGFTLALAARVPASAVLWI